jgi:pyruvate dehydrogenase E1 component beta subunit
MSDQKDAPGTSIVTYRQALHDTLRSELARDENVFLVGEEIGVFEGSYKITAGLLQEFGPKRVLDTPIAEEGFTGVALGAAMVGMRPVVEIMTINFALLAMDQIVNHAAKMRSMFGGQVSVPLVIRTPGGGGQQLAATHSQNLEVWFAHVPGLKVVAPATPADAKALLTAAIRDDDPVIFLENKVLYTVEGEVPEESYTIPFGEANVVREGDDVSVVAIGRMVGMAQQAAGQLAADGIDCEVVDLRTTSPLDEDSIYETVEKTGRLVVVDEDNPRCGMAADIAALVAQNCFDDLQAPVQMVTAPHTPPPFSGSLEDLYVPSAEKIGEAVRRTTGGKVGAGA